MTPSPVAAVSSPVGAKVKPARRKDRRPDPSLDSTISSISTNIEFKRMLIFGLRTLSQLCSISNRQFVDNCCACVDKGVIAMLATIIEKHPNDSEVINLVSRTLQGFMKALVQDSFEDVKAQDKIAELTRLCETLLCQALNSIVETQSPIWDLQSSIVQDFRRLDCPILTEDETIKLLLSEIEKERLGRHKTDLLLNCFISGCGNDQGKAFGHRALLPFLKLLQHTLQASPRLDRAQDELLQQAVGNALVLVDPNSISEEVMNLCIRLLDSTAHMKPLQTALSHLLAKMVTGKQVEDCVQKIAKGGDAALQSLNLLRAFSYVPECGERFASSGGIPLLCQVVKSVAVEEKSKTGVVSACQMIASLTTNTQYVQEFVRLGCAEGLVALGGKLKNEPIMLDSILRCLVNISKHEPNTSRLVASSNVLKLFTALDFTDPCQSSAALALLAVVLKEVPSSAQQIMDVKMDTKVMEMLKAKEILADVDDISCGFQVLAALAGTASKERQRDWLPGLTNSLRQLDSRDVVAADSGLKLLQNLDSSEFKVVGMSQCLLNLSLTFRGEPSILTQIRRLLENTACEADVKAAVTSLNKHAPNGKANAANILDAIAAVNGLAGIERLRDAVRKEGATAAVLKASESLLASNPFPEQQKLVSCCLDCLATLFDACPSTSGTEVCVALMTVVTSSQLKTVLMSQTDSEDNTLLDLLKAVHRIARYDTFEDVNSLSRVLEAVSVCMRRYPEHRRAQMVCIEILTTLLAAKSADVSGQFVQSGVAKQILTFLAKAAVHEDLQRLGLRLILVCAQRNPQNSESLRQAGAMDAVKAAARTHVGKSEIQKLVAHLTRLLTPEEQAKAEVSEQVSLLKLAAKNRDLLTGKEALKSLADLTVAADAAKHAAKSGVGDTVNTFYEAMRSAQTPAAEMEMCSGEAVNIVRNIGSVGRPHSSLILKCGGLFLLKSVLEDAYSSQSSTGDALFLATLEAARLLLTHEKNPYIVPGAPEFQAFLSKILPAVLTDETSGDRVISVVSAMGIQVNEKLLANSDFIKGMRLAVPCLRNSKSEMERVANLQCLYHVFNRPTARSLATLFAEAGGCDLLMSMLETYADSEMETTTWTRKVLEKIVFHSDDAAVRRALVKRGGATEACRAFGRSLGMCKDDVEAAKTAVNLLTHFTAKMEKSELAATGLLEVIETVLELHSKDHDLRIAVAHLLGNFGADHWVAEYFKQVVDLLSRRPKDWRRDLVEVLKKLEVFIPAEAEDEKTAFAGAPAAVRKMAECLSEFKGDAEVLPAIMMVCATLEAKFHQNPSSEFGARVMVPELMQSVVKLIINKDPAAGTLQMRGFLRDAYTMLDGLVTIKAAEVSDPTRKFVIDNKFLQQSWHLLERYPKDVEVTTAIVTFLAHFPQDPGSYRNLDEARAAAPAALQRAKCPDSTGALLHTAWQIRREPAAAGKVVGALGNVLMQTRKLDGFLSNSEYTKKLHDLASQSPEGAAAYGEMLRQVLQREDASDSQYDAFFEDGLGLLVKEWLRIRDDDAVPDSHKDAVVRELGVLMSEYVKRGRQNIVKKLEVPTLMSDALKQRYENRYVVEQLAKAFEVLSSLEDQRDLVISKVCPTLMVEAGDVVASHPHTASAALTLVLSMLTGSQEACTFMRGLNGLRETLEHVTVMAQSQPPEMQQHLIKLVTDIKRLLDTVKSAALTLEEIYRRWSHRKETGDDLAVAESGVLLNEFQFAVQATADFSRGDLLRTEDPATREFTFGCLCFGLLHENSRNVETCVEKQVQNFFVATLKRDINPEVAQYIVNAALPALETREGKQAWGSVESAAETAVLVVSRGHSWKSSSEDRKEAFLVKRLEFMEKLSPARSFYDGTDALKILNEIWVAVDSNTYTLDVLKGVARVLRCLVNEYWADEFLNLRIPHRLLERIENTSSPYALLIDLLFCAGSMASVVSIKSAIGEAGGVEKIVDLLKRCEKAPHKTTEVSATQQNACLALGALVILHGPNINAFGAAKGVDLVLRVMRSSMTGKVDYDLANAASVLITNVSFQRDDYKELLGKRGAAPALLLSIQNYDGIETESACRCLISMFKGIQNLALLPQNTQRFLAENVSDCLITFYRNGKSLSDTLIQHSLKTLSNLTLENSDDFMREFGQLMPALLSLLEDSNRSDPEMLSFIFETFASLCRYDENRKAFIQRRGVEIVLKYLNSIKSEKLYEQGLALLAVLASDSVAVENMVHSNIFPFILSLLDDSEELNADLIIAGLKVIRRLVQDRTAADAFIEAAPTSLLTDVIIAAASQANSDAPSAVTTSECLRILLQLLHLHPPAFGTQADESSRVVHDPVWRQQLTAGGSSKSRSFSRLFQAGSRSRSSSSATGLETETEELPPTAATTGGETSSNEGSPVALESPDPNDDIVEDGQTLFKPRGPRSYEKVGLDPRSSVAISRALYEMLVSQTGESLRLDRLTDLSMTFMAHMVSEKMDGCAIPFAEDPQALGDIVFKIYAEMREKNGDAKRRLVFEGTEFLCNLVCLLDTSQLKMLAANSVAMGAIKSCALALHPRREANLKRKVDEIWALLQTEPDQLRPSLFYPLASYDFPVATADFSWDVYPNGVHDLSQQIKRKIRKGGRCQFVYINDQGTPQLMPMAWKSSADLSQVTFITDKKSTNSEIRIPVSRLRVIDRGLTGTPLVRQHAKALKLWAGSTCSIAAGPANVLPDGAELVLVFPTRFHCRRFYCRLREWQCAATI